MEEIVGAVTSVCANDSASIRSSNRLTVKSQSMQQARRKDGHGLSDISNQRARFAYSNGRVESFPRRPYQTSRVLVDLSNRIGFVEVGVVA